MAWYADHRGPRTTASGDAVIDIATARTLLHIAAAYDDRPLPEHIRADLREITNAEHLPSYVRRDARRMLEREGAA